MWKFFDNNPDIALISIIAAALVIIASVGLFADMQNSNKACSQVIVSGK